MSAFTVPPSSGPSAAPALIEPCRVGRGELAAELGRDTIREEPLDGWLKVIGWWEVVIGVTFLFPATTRVAIGLMALQMAGTFMPLVLLPEVTFQPGRLPFGLTMEGQYIIKNILIIAAAIALGGTVRDDVPRTDAAHAPGLE